jgi:hypothetical protein
MYHFLQGLNPRSAILSESGTHADSEFDMATRVSLSLSGTLISGINIMTEHGLDCPFASPPSGVHECGQHDPPPTTLFRKNIVDHTLNLFQSPNLDYTFNLRYRTSSSNNLFN